MSNILIIGASGYIGSRLSYCLAKEGNNITAACHSGIPTDKEWCNLMNQVVVRDITSKDVIEELTNQYYDTAIHLVSLDHKASNKIPEFVNSVNVMPVWNLLEAFKIKKTLKRFVYFSTIHVYGKLPNDVIDESFVSKPINPYALTHLMAENICNMYNLNSDIQCVNVRLSNSYGSPFFKENNCWWLVVNDICRMAFTEKRIVLKSDGSGLRDFIHYEDIFNAIKSILSKPSYDENTFNISSGKTTSILQLAEKIKHVFLSRYGVILPTILPHNCQVQKELTKTYTISNKKLISTGFKQGFNLEKGINELFDYLELHEK
ncbi:NAD(P)-dependent oxidoreductase [Flavobacteriaceae bacterium]|nr:NAD(P)-dependent oxidoreductase [Flavobacteriaceae bacterium]